MRNFRRLSVKPRGFARDRSGTIAILFAIALPVLLLLTASLVDYAMVLRQKAWLQGVIDKAALAAAQELSLSDAKRENVPAIVQAVVDNLFKVHKTNYPAPALTVNVNSDPLEVKVVATQDAAVQFGGAFGLKNKSIQTRSVARVVGTPNICLLVLNTSTNGALSLEQKAHVTGNNCAAYSNSTHNIGIKAKSSSLMKADTICSAGGYQNSGANFQPRPIVDCPQFEDPLKSRPAPIVGSCSNPTVITSTTTLPPGTYCGLTIKNGARVTLTKGTFVIKNGPLIVRDGAILEGKDVGFYFTGSQAFFNFEGATTISLEAPTTGPMAGLLIFTDRASALQHKLYSENAQVLVGTIYIPKGELRIDGAAKVGNQSAYTAIVAEKVRLYGGPKIVFNTNYDQTDVPVPEGIKGAGQPVRLVK